MSENIPAEPAVPLVVETEDPAILLRRVGIVALFAILLGFLMQGLILAGKLAAGGVFPGHLYLVSLAQGVTWSFLVCLGVAIGVHLGKARALLAGLIAMIFAPIAVAMAKASQKAMASLIGAADQPGALSLTTLGSLRAAEYGLLGWLLARLAQKRHGGAARYFGTGAAIGVVFGGIVFVLTYRAATIGGTAPDLPQMVGMLINEIGFPIGCAFIIYAGQMVARGMAQTAPG